MKTYILAILGLFHIDEGDAGRERIADLIVKRMEQDIKSIDVKKLSSSQIDDTAFSIVKSWVDEYKSVLLNKINE